MKRFCFLVIVCMLAACAPHRQLAVSDKSVEVVFDKSDEWHLVSLSSQKVAPDCVFTLKLNPETNAFTATGPCNSFYGDFSAYVVASSDMSFTHYSLSFSNLSSTKVQCPNGQMKFEKSFNSALVKATRVSLSAYELVVYQRDKE